MENLTNPVNTGTERGTTSTTTGREIRQISKTELTKLRNEDFYTVDQVATYYGITNQQATRAIKAAGLNTKLVGRQRNSFILVD